MRRTVTCLSMVALSSFAACGGSSGSRGGISTDPVSDDSQDAGATAPGPGNGGADTPPTSAGLDASSPGGGAADAAAGPLDQVVEYLTCKPEELNPVLDCLTVQCPMQSDPIALVTCLSDDCAKLVEDVSPKCRDCVLAGIAQDTAGLVQDCLDTRVILGDAGAAAVDGLGL